MAIISASDYKTWKGISATTWDTQLAVMVPAAQDAAERFCERKFDEDTYTEVTSGEGSEYLFLPNTPIESITSITYLSESGDQTVVDSDAYRFDPNTGVVWRLSGADGWGIGCRAKWTEGFRNYSVVYKGGYDAGGTPAPASLKAALYGIIDAMLAKSPGGGLGPAPQFQSEALGDYNYTRLATSEELASIRAALAPFRRGVL